MLNQARYPSDVVALVVLRRLRYKLSLRDLPEMFARRGMVFSHEAVCAWEAKLTLDELGRSDQVARLRTRAKTARPPP